MEQFHLRVNNFISSLQSCRGYPARPRPLVQDGHEQLSRRKPRMPTGSDIRRTTRRDAPEGTGAGTKAARVPRAQNRQRRHLGHRPGSSSEPRLRLIRRRPPRQGRLDYVLRTHRRVPTCLAAQLASRGGKMLPATRTSKVLPTTDRGCGV